jgi:hypothetical protein
LILQANFGASDQEQWWFRKSRRRIRSGPDTEIDERARAVAGAKPVERFGRTKSIFSNENSQRDDD